MTQLSLTDIAKQIKDIDIAMLSTFSADGTISARPMSNNGDVEYDGDHYFFSFEDTHTIPEIEANDNVGVTFVGSHGILGKSRIFIAIEGKAQLIREKSAFREHWNADIEDWAKDGIDTPGLVLIKVHAVRIHYWDGRDEGELTL